MKYSMVMLDRLRHLNAVKLWLCDSTVVIYWLKENLILIYQINAQILNQIYLVKLRFCDASLFVFQLFVCIWCLLRSRLKFRAVQHLFWMSVHPNLIAPYLVPACLFAINANINVHMQVEMDPISYQVLFVTFYLAGGAKC